MLLDAKTALEKKIKKNPNKNVSKLTISITNQHLRSCFTMNYQRPSPLTAEIHDNGSINVSCYSTSSRSSRSKQERQFLLLIFYICTQGTSSQSSVKAMAQ